ncbi:MAG: cupin [Pseudomonadota bacterium]
MTALSLSNRPVHLGLGATAEVEPAFTGDLSWYEGYLKRHGGDGAEGRLVSMHTFTESWDSWEMHPDGAELVLCTAGEMTLRLEMPDGSRGEVTLTAGEYAINAPGVWHTADVKDTVTAVFVTAGQGTQHRPR